MSDESAPLKDGLVRAASDDTAPHQEKYQVSLPDWSGPFDILLQVIEERNLNLLDLDISSLLEGYMEYLQSHEQINLDEAGEFLLVAATLAQIKSKLLLPKEEQPEEEEKDPREDLVRYLQEYQKIKQAAQLLNERPVLGRDVFLKGVREHFEGAEAEGHGNLFQLVRGFQKVLKDLRAQTPFNIETEEVSVSERLSEVFETIRQREEVEFHELLYDGRSKMFVVVTFLSILEMVRLKKVRIVQADASGRIWLRFIEGASSEDLLKSEFDESMALSDEERTGEASNG